MQLCKLGSESVSPLFATAHKRTEKSLEKKFRSFVKWFYESFDLCMQFFLLVLSLLATPNQTTAAKNLQTYAKETREKFPEVSENPRG